MASKMKVVYLNEACVRTFSGAHVEEGQKEQRIRLVPGRNLVDAAMFETVTTKNEDFERAVIEETVVVEGDEVNIAKVSDKRAISLLNMEVSAAGVQELLDQEQARERPRKLVVEAAEKRLALLQKAESAPKGKAADDENDAADQPQTGDRKPRIEVGRKQRAA